MLTVAAKDPRIAAVVSQCPFTDGFASLPKMGPTNVVKASVAGLRDQLGALVGRPAQDIPAVGNARSAIRPSFSPAIWSVVAATRDPERAAA